MGIDEGEYNNGDKSYCATQQEELLKALETYLIRLFVAEVPMFRPLGWIV
jgi:hypothetical protein